MHLGTSLVVPVVSPSTVGGAVSIPGQGASEPKKIKTWNRSNLVAYSIKTLKVVHIKKKKKIYIYIYKVHLTYTQFQGHISHELPAGWITASPYYTVNLKIAPLFHTDGVHDLGSRAQSGFKISFIVLPPIPGYLFIPYERWNVETVHMTFTLEKDWLFIQQIFIEHCY